MHYFHIISFQFSFQSLVVKLTSWSRRRLCDIASEADFGFAEEEYGFIAVHLRFACRKQCQLEEPCGREVVKARQVFSTGIRFVMECPELIV